LSLKCSRSEQEEAGCVQRGDIASLQIRWRFWVAKKLIDYRF
jgi:hypothetical protein